MTEARPFVIGIDPGNEGGIAVLTVAPHPALLYAADARTGNSAAGPQLALAVCRAVAAAEGMAAGVYTPSDDLARAIATREGGARPLLAVVEGQFVGVNPHSAIELARSAGQWVEAALNLGLLAELVAPSTWQAGELSGGRRWKSAQLEAAARDKVAALWPKLADRAPHVHAAVLIGRWAAVRAFWGTGAARGPKATRPRFLRPGRRP